MRYEGRGRWVWMAAFVAAATLLGAVRWHRGAARGLTPVDQRPAMEGVSLQVLGGGVWKVGEHRGEVVLINHWATWCEPCREELPGLIAVAQEDGAKGFAVVGVAEDVGADAEAKVREFVARYRVPYTVGFPEVRVSDPFGVMGLPNSVLVDRQGRVVKRYLGVVEREELEKDVMGVMGER